MRRRDSARLLILNGDGHLLLFRFVHTKGPLAGQEFWQIVGLNRERIRCFAVHGEPVHEIARGIGRKRNAYPLCRQALAREFEFGLAAAPASAAELIGMGQVPVVRLSNLRSAERKAYVLADNKLALNAGWDREVLAIELQGLIDLGFEVLQLGNRHRSKGHRRFLRVAFSLDESAEYGATTRCRQQETAGRLELGTKFEMKLLRRDPQRHSIG